MRRMDREEWKEEKKDINRKNIRVDRYSQVSQRTTPETREFALTQNQRLIIQHRLPKGYALIIAPKTASNIKKTSNRLRNYSPASTKNYQKEQNNPMRIIGSAVRENQLEDKQGRKKKGVKSESSDMAEIIMIDDGSRGHDSIDLVSDTPEPEPPKVVMQKTPQSQRPIKPVGRAIKSTLNQQKQEIKFVNETTILSYKESDELENPKEPNQVFQQTPVQQKEPVQSVAEEMPVRKIFSEQFAILKQLKRHKGIALFLHPVNQQRDGAPGYYKAIKQPMDIQTMEFKLMSGKYKESIEFHLDLERMLSNSRIYNKNNKGMIQLTNQIQQYYEKITREVRKKSETDKKTPVERVNTRNSKKESLSRKKASKR